MALCSPTKAEMIRVTPRRALAYHAETGNLTAILNIRKKGYSLELPDSKGNTALCEEVWRQNRVGVATLIRAGANVNASCMRQIPMAYRQILMQNNYSYPVWANGYNEFARQPAMASTWADAGSYTGITKTSEGIGVLGWTGIGVGAAVIAGGIVAMATSGGGGGHSKSSGGNKCSDYVESCGQGWHPISGDQCQTNGKTYVKCEENACSGYKVGSCPEYAQNCQTCWRGTTETYSFSKCQDGYEGDNCTPIVCPYTTKECTGDYEETGNTCQSGQELYKECRLAVCPGYVSGCGTGYHAIPGETCEAGGNTYVKCEENECNGYTVGTCPEHAVDCQTCWRGGTETHLFSDCQSGYEGDTCSPVNCGEGYVNIASCPEHATCSAPCYSAGDTLLKITNCEDPYTISEDKKKCIFECPANQYAVGTTCNNCPTGATSPKGSEGIDSCICAPGYAVKDGACVSVDFPNIGAHPANGAPANYVTNEFKKGRFLEQINAQYAYARGYNGYVVNRNSETGELIGDDGNYSTGSKVRVGIMDNGFDINHPDLKGNIVKGDNNKVYGYNFDYGPCRNGDTTHCYGFKARKTENGTEYGDLVFYKTGATDFDVVDAGNDSDGWWTASTVSSSFSQYSSTYDWDALKNDPAPHDISSDETSVERYSNMSGNDHGTHVAGIIGATQNELGMMGVAPNAELVVASRPGAFFVGGKWHGYGFDETMETLKNEGVRVVNMSFGAPTRNSTDEVSYAVGKSATLHESDSAIRMYQIAAENNIVSVKAAGNDGNYHEASIDCGIPLSTEFLPGSQYDQTNLFITVVAADKDNKLASYSQYCGAAAGYCLTAPGGDISRGVEVNNDRLEELIDIYRDNPTTGNLNAYYDYLTEIHSEWGIYSTVQDNSSHAYITEGTSKVSYGYAQGTSMATPVVTGSVALLMSAYPHLTSQQIVEILFRSANKNLVNWGGALNSTISDSLSTWTDSFGNTYEISKIYGHGMVDLKAATEPLGDLQTPTTQSVSSKQPLSDTRLALPKGINKKVENKAPKSVLALDDYNRPFAVSIEGKVKSALRDPDSFKRDFRSFMSKTKVQKAGVEDKLSFSFASSKTDKNLLGLGILDVNYRFNESSQLKFSYRSDTINEKLHIDKVLANPFINMKDSYSLAQQWGSEKLKFLMGVTTGKNAFYETDSSKDEEFKHSVHVLNSEVSYRPHRSLTFKAVGGMMKEKDALLGMNGSGAFATDDGKTYFTGASVEYKPLESVTLSAAYYYGRSSIPQTRSLVKIKDVISDSFAFDARYQADDEKTIGLQFSSPLRIREGHATFNLPVARDMYVDRVYFDEQKVSLKPNSREYDLGLYYMVETDTYDWRSELMMRLHPDHMAGAQPDYRALLGLSYKY